MIPEAVIFVFSVVGFQLFVFGSAALEISSGLSLRQG